METENAYRLPWDDVCTSSLSYVLLHVPICQSIVSYRYLVPMRHLFRIPMGTYINLRE